MRRRPKLVKTKAEGNQQRAGKSPKADEARVRDIEMRLAKAEKDKAEARAQQAATSEILRVISQSHTDVQPVFDTIVKNTVRLCNGLFSTVFQFDGELVHLAATHNLPPAGLDALHRLYPMRPTRVFASGRAILERALIHISDVELDPESRQRAVGRAAGWRSALVVPMMREGTPIGVVTVGRTRPGQFSDTEIELLKTFADQAVIAVENARLFTETREALERQTATSEILGAIASSPTQLQPVLDAVVKSAARFCAAPDASIFRLDGDNLRAEAHHGPVPQPAGFLVPVVRGSVAGRSVLEQQTVHVADLQNAADEFPEGSALARQTGQRATLSAPLLREGTPMGAILLRRAEAKPFTDKQVALLQIFADQAVIAIENVRLFKELQERNQDLAEALSHQTATSEILRVIAGSPTNLRPVLDALAASAARLCRAADTFLLLVEGDQLKVAAVHGSVGEDARLSNSIHRGWVAGRAVADAQTVHVEDLANAETEFALGREIAVRLGHRTVLATPLLREDAPIGAIFLRRREVRQFSAKEIALVKTFADQAVIAIENVRLFNELEVANRELQAASQHKSEFLANMSHELRTPLNAVIGFSDVLLQQMFGELNAKQDEYLKDISASGQHLLSLINDILDLSKIEAGHMELVQAPFHLPTALDNAVILVRERAARHGIALELDLDPRLAEVVGDERKVKQVVLNLLSNAVKFTPEMGRIRLRAGERDGAVEIAVTDTGVGIAPEDQQAIFEEFRQVGSEERRREGTGLGLALAKKFVELHGGRIWVESQLGRGSTFTFTLPLS
jgi:two-component system, NtrC family, sensor kinase